MAKGKGLAFAGGGGKKKPSKGLRLVPKAEKMTGPGHTMVEIGSAVTLGLATKKMGDIPTPLGVSIKPDVAGLILAGAVALLGKGKSKKLARSAALGAAHAVSQRWITEGSSPLSATKAKPEASEKTSEKDREAAREKRERQTQEAVEKEVQRAMAGVSASIADVVRDAVAAQFANAGKPAVSAVA
jgi:hypothetical protein